MLDTFNDIALTAAINVLRDSIESGRMPSGQPLEADAAALHERAADHFEAVRREARSSAAAPTGEGQDVRLTAAMTGDQAWALAQFFKRAGYSDYRGKAQTDEEAYAMRDAAELLRQALADVGFAPR